MDGSQTAQLSPLVAPGRRALLSRPLVRLGLLLAVAAAAHSYSLTSGLWLDDHLHYQQLRQAGWNFRDLVNASTLDAGIWRVRFWGSLEHELRFFRPVAFGLMKAEYTLIGWQPVGMHLFNLFWHLAVAWLVGMLAAKLLEDAVAGTVAALLFASFPNHVPTVYWIACQTELMVTFFVLAATLTYGQWAGWWTAGGVQEIQDREQGPGPRIPDEAGDPAKPSAPHRPSLFDPVCLVLCVLAFTLALGCRENAIVLPAILIAGDLLAGRPRALRQRIPIYLLLAVMAGAYLLVREQALSGMAWPHRPYMIYPSDPEFLQFASRKVLYYLSGLLLYVVILPGSAMTFFAEKTPMLPIGAAWSVLVIAACLLLWRRRTVLLGAVWTVLVMLPTLPVEPSPHHLYLPGVGSALLLSALLLGAWRALRRHRPGLARKEPWASGIVGGFALLLALAGCFAYGRTYVFGTATEDQLVSDVLERGDPLHPGDELFFINQPMIAGWPGPAIETASNGRLHHLRSCTLTLSDEVLLATRPSYVTVLDRYNLRLQMEAPGWFSSPASSRIFADLSGASWPFQAGQVVPGPVFDVTIERMDEGGGITSLRFTFHEPIDKPGRHFYFGSPQQVAYPLHFQWDRTPIVTGP